MSDSWNFYPVLAGGKMVHVFYDHGIHDSIDHTAPPRLLTITLRLLEPLPNGTPGRQEAEVLDAIEEAVMETAARTSSVYAGRATTDGLRHFYVYTDADEARWRQDLDKSVGPYLDRITYQSTDDPRHRIYWDKLFPDDDQWQVILDLQVISVLHREGDDGTTARLIDHWSCFSSEAAASSFFQWAAQQGYENVRLEEKAPGDYNVTFTHTGTLDLNDINSHTLPLRRMSASMGGRYDGWETRVCRE